MMPLSFVPKVVRNSMALRLELTRRRGLHHRNGAHLIAVHKRTQQFGSDEAAIILIRVFNDPTRRHCRPYLILRYRSIVWTRRCELVQNLAPIHKINLRATT